VLLVATLALVPLPGVAQVYRSVDEAGRITYSDTPPKDSVAVEPVEIAPGPTADEVRESQARVEADREQLDSMRAAREAEQEKAREARIKRLEEEALRAAANPPPLQQPVEPMRRRWGYYGYGYGVPGYPRFPRNPGYPGYPVRPHPKPPIHLPIPHKAPPPRPKVLDSPLYNKSTSPVYR